MDQNDKNELRKFIEDALVGGGVGTAANRIMQRLEQPFEEARIQSEQAEAYAKAIDLIWGQAKLDLDGLRAPHEWPLASKVFDILHHDAPGSISEGDERAYLNHEKPANLAKELYDLGVKAEALRLERDSLHAKVRSMQDLAKGALDGTSEHQLLQDNCIALQAILDS